MQTKADALGGRPTLKHEESQFPSESVRQLKEKSTHESSEERGVVSRVP